MTFYAITSDIKDTRHADASEPAPQNNVLLDLARALIPVVKEAGSIELQYYHKGIAVTDKADGTPVTLADQHAENHIIKRLAEIAPGIPVVGEEGFAAGTTPDISSGMFFLVDALDGTREFVLHNGDFTVNIGLVVDGRPVMGIIYAPLCGNLFFAGGDEAFSLSKDGVEKKLKVRDVPEAGLTVLSGRRANDEKNTAETLKGRKIAAIENRSSSLKFCAIAAGEADIYPRIGKTCEWDTAAAEAILRAAGGNIVQLSGEPMAYGNVAASFANPDFIAFGHESAWPIPRPARSLLRPTKHLVYSPQGFLSQKDDNQVLAGAGK